MKKKWCHFVVIIAAAVLGLSGCGPSLDEDSLSQEEWELTLEDIKKNYAEDEILDIRQFDRYYVLVESHKKGYANRFELYNLKTGDRDVLPTMPEYVTLEEIVSPNIIVFLSSGKNSESVYQTFPYLIKCVRVKEDPKAMDDFIPITKDKLFRLGEQIIKDYGKEGVLSRVVITLDGVQFLFRPIPGREADFYAAFTDIPPTSICFSLEKRQMIITFKDALIDGSLRDGSVITAEFNPYISAVEVKKQGKNAAVIISLSEAVEQYHPDIERLALPEGLPYMVIYFGKGG